MADGEIELRVNADGVEDAAGELDETATEPGGGADGGGRRGGGVGGAGGRMVRLLGAIAGLLALIEPVLDVLGVVSNILKAFVAPLAVVLLRALQPVLRLLLELLPGWINWVNENEGMLTELTRMAVPLITILPLIKQGIIRAKNFLQKLPGRIDTLKQDLKDKLSSLITDVQNLPGDIKAFVSSLPGDIGSEIAERLPGDFSDTGSGVASGLRGNPPGADATAGERAGGALGTLIRISGGLTPLIDTITRDGNVDLG